MSLEALWTVNFSTLKDETLSYGGGVVIFETNRIFGGDASFYYLGHFTCKNEELECNLKIVKHGSGDNIFGFIDDNEFEIFLSGKYVDSASTIKLEGKAVANSAPLIVDLTYRAPLP